MAKENFNNDEVKRAAEIMGAATKLARSIDVGELSVYRWIHGQSIPEPLSCLKIEKATGGKVKARDIRPDFDFDAYIEELKSII